MDSLGPEALLQASRDCKFRLVRLLIDGGTLANVRNENQETPLILVCKSESEEKEKVVEFLIRQRVKVNLQDIYGRTALMYACIANSSDNVIRMLVNSKANPWLVDESNNTAFDYAINAGNIGIVKLMIQACREGKILTKPGSFNMEMKRIENRLDEMPEIRKCSWPLMGPRNSTVKEKKCTNQSGLLAVNEMEEIGESPTRERRRKRSICHFDPIDLEAGEGGGESDSSTNPIRKSSLYSASRSASEDERISLHFSDSDNSSFDRSSTNFSSLEKLLGIRDSVSSSVESNDNVNAQNCQSAVLKKEGSLNSEKELQERSPQKTCSEIDNDTDITNCTETVINEVNQKDARKENNGEESVEKESPFQSNMKFPREKENDTDAENFGSGNRKKNLIKYNKGEGVLGNAQTINGLVESLRSLPCGIGRNTCSPLVPRRITLGSLAASQPNNVTEDYERKRSEKDSETTRRFTVGAMEMRTDDKRKVSNLCDEEQWYRPSPPPRDLHLSGSRKPITTVFTSHETASSPEMRLSRKKNRSPEVEFVPNNSCFTEQEINRKFENTIIQNNSDKARVRQIEHLKSEVKSNVFMPFNLPIISPPERTANKEKNESRKNIQTEKTTVRRTLSDSVSQARRRASAVDSRQNHQESSGKRNIKKEMNSACVDDFTAASVPVVTRERSSSFTPLSTTAINTPPLERKSYLKSNVTCDIVTMATSSNGRESPRSRTSRNKLSSDLPDLVLHAPRSRIRSPNNLDPFSLSPELQVSDPTLTRYVRSAPTTPETLVPGSQTYLTGNHTGVSKSSNSYSHLPEVVSSTTGSPKVNRREAFLPPLNIARKPSESEEGYFSCSPSPLDLESPNRGKEKSKYSFKPSSPRLMTRPVQNLLP